MGNGGGGGRPLEARGLHAAVVARRRQYCGDTRHRIAATLAIAASADAGVEGATGALAYAGVGARQAFLVDELVGAGFTGQRDAPSTVFGRLLGDRFDPDVACQGDGGRCWTRTSVTVNLGATR